MQNQSIGFLDLLFGSRGYSAKKPRGLKKGEEIEIIVPEKLISGTKGRRVSPKRKVSTLQK